MHERTNFQLIKFPTSSKLGSGYKQYVPAKVILIYDRIAEAAHVGTVFRHVDKF